MVPQTTIRALALVWQLNLSIVRLGIRLIWQHRERSNVLGQTLAELFQQLGPTYIKLGQLLSTRRDIFSDGIIRELERLQDRLPPIDFSVVPQVFREELLIDIDAVFSDLEQTPIANASVASVFRGRLRDGKVVALKVLRPGIRSRVNADLRVIKILAAILNQLPAFRYVPLRAAAAEFAKCIERQLNLNLEAAANKRIHRALGCEPRILVPRVIEELCGSSILTMEFLDGLHGVCRRNNDQARLALLAALRALYRMIFVEGFIHCDLHQGNLHFLPDGRAVIIDFGFMAEFTHAERLKFAEFFFAMSTNDGARCARIMYETAMYSPAALDYKKFEEEILNLINRVSNVKAREFQVAKFVFDLFNVQRRYRMLGTTTFVMAITALLVFEGIAKDVYPDLDFQSEVLPFILRASIRRIDREPMTWSIVSQSTLSSHVETVSGA